MCYIFEKFEDIKYDTESGSQKFNSAESAKSAKSSKSSQNQQNQQKS